MLMRSASLHSHRHAVAAVAWARARELAHAATSPLPARTVPLEEAGGAVLASALVAPVAVPPVDRAAMDGYAVRGAGPWAVVGAVLAGSAHSVRLADGQACAIVTGATVPAGGTAVLPDEDAVRDGNRLTGTIGPRRHVRRAGEECAAGEVLLPAGVVVHPPVLGLAASLGLDCLSVIPKPRVIALVTGDELVSHGRSGPGRVRDAIGPMLPGLLERAGAEALPGAHLPDSRSLLIEALAATDADLILVSGSSASGPADHLRAALQALDAELLVDGVACRPGHPQALARLQDGRLVVGLPGNPFAAFAAFLTLAVAAIAGLRGEPLPALPTAPLAGGLDRHPTSTRLVPVRVRSEGAVPVGHAGSAMLRGPAGADALAIIDPGTAIASTARLLPLDPGARPWGV